MNEPTKETVVQRLDGLKSDHRRLKLVGVLAVMGLAALALTGEVAVSEAAEAKVTAGKATVKRDRVPVYEDKTTNSRLVTVLARKTVVTFEFALSGPEGAWCHVTVSTPAKRTGYVRCEDLERELLTGWRLQVPGVRAGPEPRDVRELREPEGQQEKQIPSDVGERKEEEITSARGAQDLQQMLHRELADIKEILTRIAKAVEGGTPRTR